VQVLRLDENWSSGQLRSLPAWEKMGGQSGSKERDPRPQALADTPTKSHGGVRKMNIRKLGWVGVCLGAAITQAWSPAARAQNCEASQNAAVDCFVGYAVKTDLTSLRYGMNLTQLKAYGVAVSKILQAEQDYVVLAGMASAVADAMPPTNANGTANTAAQQTAMDSIVQAEIACGLVTLPAQVSQQQAEYFSLDLVNSMNAAGGIVLSPGFLLRVVDSYTVSGTSGGTVNWTQVNSQLATMVSSLSSSGLLKLPASVKLGSAQTFTQDLAQTIYAYKQATGKTSL
jgi:hypothetical protein